ncbi:MAG: GNAT family N-acetyltransferase [Bacteroidales bacterium]|nr:GNAT family N-acetyltransferase [Bacteroidales bacterium]
MSVCTIVEAKSGKDLKEFVKFPDRLYAGNGCYVPALHSGELKSLEKAAPLAYCTRRCWLAKRDGRTVGRICAMVNPRYNELYSKKRARFGWFDCIDDYGVAEALLRTAEDWAKEQGMDEIHGPLYYNTLGKQGMLVEGFEHTPPFNCLYNYPYYADFVERYGFVKECDWLQYEIDVTKGVPEKTMRVADIVEKRYGLHFVSVDKLKKDPEMVMKFFHAYSDSFAQSVYNFIPFTDEEIREETAGVMPFISDRTSSILMDRNGEVAAFGIATPSISEALKKARGRLFPFGWFHLLRALRNCTVTDFLLNGAVPDWQNKGVSALYYREIAKKVEQVGGRIAITNPQLEMNSAVNIWKDYGRKPFMRRRCYIKNID